MKRTFVVAMGLIACAAEPAEVEEPAVAEVPCALQASRVSAIPPNPTGLFPTPRFLIHYYNTVADRPLRNCTPTGPRRDCYRTITGATDPNHPDYIEDLAVFLEQAHASYLTRGFDVPTIGRIEVHVYELGARGMVEADGQIHIDRDVAPDPGEIRTVPDVLRQTAWHELFHVAQARTFSGGPAPMPPAVWDRFLEMAWLFEATADHVAFAAVPGPGRFGHASLGLLQIMPLTPTRLEMVFLYPAGYASFPLFRYLDQQYPFDFVKHLFGAADPHVTYATTLPTDSHDRILYRELNALLGADGTRAALRDFALAHQFTRDEAKIPGIRTWLFPVEGITLQLSGFERHDPGLDDEPPLAMEPSIPVPVVLQPGMTATYSLGFAYVLCDPPGPGCNGTNAIPLPDRAKVRIAGAVPHHHGAAWRVSRDGDAELLGAFSGGPSDLDLSYPLSAFRRTDRLVITIAHDHEAAGAASFTPALEASFDHACRAHTIVVDHPQSQVGWYGGPGFEVETPEGCTTMLAKLWGGGGPLAHAGGPVPAFLWGDGGGGGSVVAKVPIDPDGERFRAVVPFSSLTGTQGGSPTWLWKPGDNGSPSEVIALAGGGGGGGKFGAPPWVVIAPPHGGGAEQDAPDAVYEHPIYGLAIMQGGGGATGSKPGAGGGPTPYPYGTGIAFNLAHPPFWSAGSGACGWSADGGAGWYGGGGGGFTQNCVDALGAGGGGGSSFVSSARLGQLIVATTHGGNLRQPGNADDPDRIIPTAADTACQEGPITPGDPGRGRSGATAAWCDEPGRIVLKFGRAATLDARGP